MRKAPAVAIMLSLALLAGCTGTGSLESEIRSAVDRAEGGELVLSSLDAVDGTEFTVVCPYESRSSVDERLGFAWSEAPDYAQADDRQTVAVVRDGTVVSSAELARDSIDFCSDEPWPLAPIDTPLAVTRSGDLLTVAPAA